MVKKPILTDDELDAGLPGSGAAAPTPPSPPSPPPLPPRSGDDSATRPVPEAPPPPPPAPASPPAPPAKADDGASTRKLPEDEAVPPPPAPPSADDGSATRVLPDGEGGSVPPAPVPPAPWPESDKMKMIPEDGSQTAPPSESGRDAAGHARPKTRIHGYGGADRAEADAAAADAAAPIAPVVGWLVVTAGPGRGAAVSLVSGMNSVGRDDGNTARIDFGDDTISRAAHAFVTYDNEARTFHLSHAGQTNVVRLNDKAVLVPMELGHGDMIRIGATTLRFVALCGTDFDWSDT